MPISLKALEAAVTRVERIRDDELTFEAGESKITLRGLRPDEDTSVQRYADEVLPKDNTKATQSTLAEYMDRMRYGILGYSVIQIDDLDLRDVDYLDTEDPETGEAYSVPKAEGLRELIQRSWSRAMLAQVFKKFTELLDKIEVRAERAIEFNPVELDDEIKRVEARLDELKQAKGKRSEEIQDNIRKTQKVVSEVNTGQQQARERVEAAKQQATQPPQSPTAPPTVSRRPQYPANVSPPKRPVEDPLVSQQIPPAQHQPQHPPTPEGVIPDPFEGNSFMDTSDPDEAIYQEGLRQEMLYKQQQEAATRERADTQRRQQEQSAKIAAARSTRPQAKLQGPVVDLSKAGGHATRDPGLRQALNTQDAVVQQTSQPPIHSAASQRPAQLGDKPVFSVGTQVLDKKQETARIPAGGIDTPGGMGSHNPRFRGTNNRGGHGSGVL